MSATIQKARSGCQTGATPAMDKGSAMAKIRDMLDLVPDRIIRQVDGDDSLFFLEIGGTRACIGGPTTILSGAKLQAKMMGLPSPHARMIERHKSVRLKELGNALLSICEIEEIPGSAELTQERIANFLPKVCVMMASPSDEGWFLDRMVLAFSAVTSVLGCKADAAEYPRVYISMNAVEEYLRQMHIQVSARSMAGDLVPLGWVGFLFQHGGKGRRLWRSPPGFWEPENFQKTPNTKTPL
jgi:hypothetical protein